VILLGLELFRKVEWKRQGLTIVWVVVALTTLSSIGTLANGSKREMTGKSRERSYSR